MAPFVVLPVMLLLTVLIILPGQRGDCLETCPSPIAQNNNNI